MNAGACAARAEAGDELNRPVPLDAMLAEQCRCRVGAVPEMNASYRRTKSCIHESINLGVAVDAPEGSDVP